MCPDRELLSAWIDGEVPEPWSGELARHLASCETCAAAVRVFREAHEAFARDADRLDGLSDGDRLRERVESTMRMRRASRERPRPLAADLWHRRVLVPAPALLAALLAVAVLSGGTWIVAKRDAEYRVALLGASSPSAAAMSGTTSGADAIPTLAAAPASGDTMQSVLEYLDRQGSPMSITIEFPSSREFGAEGRPVILREAEFQAGAKR